MAPALGCRLSAVVRGAHKTRLQLNGWFRGREKQLVELGCKESNARRPTVWPKDPLKVGATSSPHQPRHEESNCQALITSLALHYRVTQRDTDSDAEKKTKCLRPLERPG